MNHVTWIKTFEELGYKSEEDKKALKEILEYVRESVKVGIVKRYIAEEFQRKVGEKFKLGFFKKIIIKKMIKAQLENLNEITEVQLKGTIDSLDGIEEKDKQKQL